MQEEINAPDEGVTEDVMPVEGENTEVETPESAPDAETVEFARMIGWKAPDEWQGEKPAGYIEDPREYVERAKSILPFRKLEDQFTQLQSTFDQRLSGIENAYTAAMERQKEQAAQQIKALKARQEKAFEEGDKDAWQAARAAEDNLRTSLDQPQEQPKQQDIPPEIRDALDNWRVDNEWFGPDKEKTLAASAAWTEAERMGIRNPQAILRFVDKKISEQFAPTPQRKTAAFEAGALSTGGSVDGFTKLPKEAKDAFKRGVKQGLFEDTKEGRAQYTKDYENG